MPPVSHLVAAALLLSLGFSAGYTISHAPPKKEAKPASLPAETLTDLKSRPFEEIATTGHTQTALQWLALQDNARSNADFEAAFRQFERGGRNEKALHELLFQWAGHDPQAALAHIKSLSSTAQLAALPHLLDGWAENDYPSLAQWLESKASARESPLLRGMAIGALASRDPNLAFSLLKEGGSPLANMLELHSLFQQLGKKDPRAALLLLDKVSGEKKQSVLSVIAINWAEHDPQAALSWVQQLEGEARSTAMRSIILKFTQESPEKAASLLLAEISSNNAQDGWSVDTTFSTLFRTWLEQDPAKAKAWIATLPESFRHTATNAYEIAFARQKPRDYLAGVETASLLTKNDERLLSTALSNLARSHPAEATSWLEKNRAWLPSGMFPNLISTLVAYSPEASVRLLPLLAAGNLSNAIYQSAAAQWADKDVAKATRFLDTLPVGEQRDAFLQGLFRHTAKTDLNAAFHQAEATPEGALRKAFLQTLGDQVTEYEKTAEWLTARFPDSAEATSALTSLVNRWASSAPEQTATWLQKAPAGKERDRLVNTFSSSIVNRDPDMAIQWAATIDNEKTRTSAMRNIAQQWLRLDREAAQEWIQTAPFTDKEKARLLK